MHDKFDPKADLLAMRGNLSQEQAAQVIGVPTAMWRRWEFGQQKVPLYVLRYFVVCAREMFCGYRS